MSAGDGSHDWLDLAERVCVVTGAGSGIGAAIAEGLTEVGARVALLDRNGDTCRRVARSLSERGARVLAIECDTSDEAAVRASARRVNDEMGPCYGLANNAGFLRPASLAEVPLADWNAMLAVNLTGYLLCAREFAQQMRSIGGGSIVHTASIAGHEPQGRSGAYSPSKAGVLLLSRQMAAEWGPSGIRSNAVCPGLIRTGMSAAFYEQPGLEERRAAITPSRRIGEPIDIANAAIFLLSKRSAYMNGAELLIDGGLGCMLMDLVPRPGFNDAR
jgi:glucose 1-dehydrogenase